MDTGINSTDPLEVMVGELPGRNLTLAELLPPFSDPHPTNDQLNWTLSAGLS
jgi:hypothetical protein